LPARVVLVLAFLGTLALGETISARASLWQRPDDSELAPRVHPVFAAIQAQIEAAGFPSPILLATDQAELFNDLLLTSAPVTADLQVGSAGWKAPGAPNYEISLGIAGGDPRLAMLDGYIGRQAFDTMAERDGSEDCPSSEDYCASTPLLAGPPIVERFYDFTVNGQIAVVDHTACCNGESWLVEWYDSQVDVSYGLELRLLLAQRVGSGINPENAAHARGLADLAATLVPAELLSRSR
jgi:hypothetical protein